MPANAMSELNSETDSIDDLAAKYDEDNAVSLCGHVELHDSAAALTVIDFFFHALQPHLCLQRRQLIVYG